MSFVLRDYQTAIIDETREKLKRAKSVLVVSPTGSGKTAISGTMAGTAASRQKRVGFVVHRRELIKQTAKTFQKVGIPFGIVAADFTGDRNAMVQICSVGTLAKRLDLYNFDLLLWDEAHHVAAKTWADVFNHYSKARHVGLSATPERLDGTGLGNWFSDIVQGPKPAWLIEQGYLSRYRLFAPAGAPDLHGVRKTAGEYNRADLEGAMSRPQLVGDVVSHYRKLGHGRRAMVFCVSIKHSLAVVEKFQAAGYRAAHIDGTSSNRDQLIEAFEAGRIEILSSVDLVSEGFDLPAIEVAILARPTHSTGLYLQQVGRVLRPFPGKDEAIILDHAGNAMRHGLPDDDREWSLDGSKKRRKAKADDDAEPEVKVRQCPTCFTVHRPAPTCPKCEYEYPSLGRTLKEVEGELKEVDRKQEQVNRKKEQAKAQTLDDLIHIGRMRNYKNPEAWARYIHQARQRRAS